VGKSFIPFKQITQKVEKGVKEMKI